MMNKGLTLTIVTRAQSLNYGEGLGNFNPLKRFSRRNGEQYTYASRQSLADSIRKKMNWDTPVYTQGSGESKVIQFHLDATIEKYPEIDLFGYMKTKPKTKNSKGEIFTRSAVVRLSDAISLETYKGDMDFLTNGSLAKRQSKPENSIVQIEKHHSYYVYTLTIDLDRVGKDGELEVLNQEKGKRVADLLEAIEFLNREIKARSENLNPLFVIGGIYECKNPFFQDRIQLENGENRIQVSTLKEILDSYDFLKKNTKVGVLTGIFDNEQEIKSELNATTIPEVFKKVKEEVKDYYGK